MLTLVDLASNKKCPKWKEPFQNWLPILKVHDFMFPQVFDLLNILSTWKKQKSQFAPILRLLKLGSHIIQ